MRNLGSEKSYIAPGHTAGKWLAPNTVTDFIPLYSLHITRVLPEKHERQAEKRRWGERLKRTEDRKDADTLCSDALCKYFVTSGLWAPGAAAWSGTAGPLGELSSMGTCIASKVVLEIDPIGAALGVSWKRPLPYNALCQCGPPHISPTVGVESNFCK